MIFLEMTFLDYFNSAMNWIYANAGGIAAAFMAYMAWRKAQENSSSIDVVHKTINSNRESDMAMSKSAGQAIGELRGRQDEAIRSDAREVAAAAVRQTNKEVPPAPNRFN